MATVTYLDPIDHISGKISKKHRTCYNYRKRSGRKYTSVHGERTTPASAAEIAWRNLFAQICAATRERMMDPNFISQDQVAFRNQTKYKTFYKFVWNIVRAEVENGE